MPRLADIRRYVGNPAMYARQLDDGYVLVEDPLNDSVLQAHLDGTITVGTYTLDFDKAKHIVFDDDTNDLKLARALERECKHRVLPAAVEWSGSKGYHVWVLLEQWSSAADVRRLAMHIAETVGFDGEVFPKQATAVKTGSLVKLPYGVHRKTLKRSRILSGEPRYVTTAEFNTALAKVPAGVEPRDATSSTSARLPCLDSLFSSPLREGERNDSLFFLACRGRKWGLGDEQVAALLESVCDPGDLDPGEFEEIVTRSATYAPPRCEVLKPDRRCAPDLCVQTREQGWKTQRPGEIRYASDGDSVVVRIHRDEKSPALIELDHPDLSLSRAALRTD